MMEKLKGVPKTKTLSTDLVGIGRGEDRNGGKG